MTKSLSPSSTPAIAWALAAFIACPSMAVAAQRAYLCEVKEQLFLNQSGELGRPPIADRIGKRFTVDRENGALVATDPLVMPYHDQKATVLAGGNGENAFVATYVGASRGGGVHASFLRVHEYEQQEPKPFLLLSGSVTFSGVCE